MSSASFRFRRFEVFHDRCAMKVGTDGVLLGAWAGQSLSEQLLSDASAPAEKSDAVADSFPILDIGTGSGLVALMLAQRFPGAHITALDIEPSAVEQAQYNFAHSPWSDRLMAVHSSLQSFPSSVRFRLIVSNPPYFRNSLKNPDKSRELARHTDSLSYSDLVAHTARLLAADGVACYILPAEAESELLSLLRAHSLCPLRILQVHSKPGKPAKRLLIEFTHLHPTPTLASTDASPSMDGSTSKDGCTSMGGSTSMEGSSFMEGSTSMEGSSFMEGSTSMEGSSSMGGSTSMEGSSSMGGSTSMEGSSSMGGSTSMEGSSSLERKIFPAECSNTIFSKLDTKNSLNSRTTPEPTRSIFYIESLTSPRSDEYASLTRDFYL